MKFYPILNREFTWIWPVNCRHNLRQATFASRRVRLINGCYYVMPIGVISNAGTEIESCWYAHLKNWNWNFYLKSNGCKNEAYIVQNNIRKKRHAKFIKLFNRNHFTMMSRIFGRVHMLKMFQWAHKVSQWVGTFSHF